MWKVKAAPVTGAEAGSVTDALDASTETTLDDVHEVSEGRSNVWYW